MVVVPYQQGAAASGPQLCLPKEDFCCWMTLTASYAKLSMLVRRCSA